MEKFQIFSAAEKTYNDSDYFTLDTYKVPRMNKLKMYKPRVVYKLHNQSKWVFIDVNIYFVGAKNNWH